MTNTQKIWTNPDGSTTIVNHSKHLNWSKIDKTVSFGKDVYLSEGVKIDAGCLVRSHVYLCRDVILRENTLVMSYTTLSRKTCIGSNLRVSSAEGDDGIIVDTRTI